MMLSDKIRSFLALCTGTTGMAFREDHYAIPVGYKQKLDDSKIPYEEYGDELRLKVGSFFGESDILFGEATDRSIQNYSLSQHLLWLSLKGVCFYDSSNFSIIVEGVVSDEQKQTFRNSIAYLKFYHFLKGISDYWNSANSEFVFYNSVSGIIKVKFEPAPVIDFPDEIASEIDQLQSFAGAAGITSVFVNAVFQLSMGTGEITLKQLITERKKVLDITKRDYELISKQFDFSMFKNSLYKEKESFFKEIREVVNKIFSQAIGIPISIGASVFTTYKVQGDNWVLVLVILAFLWYMAFYLRLQWIYKRDLDDVNSQFQTDFAIIASESGLPSSTIDAEKTKIENRISSVIVIQRWLIGLVIGLTAAATIFMVSQFSSKRTELPDPTIKELTDAIRKFTAMSNASKNDSKLFSLSPVAFPIKVEFDKKVYDIAVVRYSFLNSPTEYWATITTPDSVINKFPPVKYVVNNEDLSFADSLKDIFPGFAIVLRKILLDEFKEKKWKL